MHTGGTTGRPPAEDFKAGAPSLVSGLAPSLSLMPFCMLARQLAQGRTEDSTPQERPGNLQIHGSKAQDHPDV